MLEKKWKHQTVPASGSRVGGAGWGGTLLGPERTTWAPVSVGVVGGCLWAIVSLHSRWGCGGRFVWSLRIVQWTRASFVSVACLCRDFLMCVLVKLSRAHGGCLGIRSR